jgi:DNA-binding transcriptional MerR regulator
MAARFGTAILLRMKHYSISELATLFGLSRSALLYYDRIGLLPASGRSGSGYRYYMEKDRRRLERARQFQEAGLSLKEIRSVLSSGGKPGSKLLQKRIGETVEEMRKIRRKQQLLTGMLRQATSQPASTPVDKKMWIELLQAAGMNQEAMGRWHREFEKRSPDGHQEFLASLGIPNREIALIRKWAASEP